MGSSFATIGSYFATIGSYFAIMGSYFATIGCYFATSLLSHSFPKLNIVIIICSLFLLGARSCFSLIIFLKKQGDLS